MTRRFSPPGLLLHLWICAALLAAAVLSLPRASAQDQPARPNILLAISDDQSWLHTSASGYRAVRTPAFDRIAREGVLFTNAFCASPGCSPSRAALLTGRQPWQLAQAGTHASSFPKEYTVYPDLLESAGYHVGYTGKGWGPGNWKASGRTRNPAGPDYNGVRVKESPAKGLSSIDYAANFEAFLKARRAGQPFCFWYGGQEPHRAFEAGVGLRSGKKLADAVVPPFLPDTGEVRSDLLDYCREIEWFDAHLGRMLETLERAGELDNTLVVVTSDNGMAFPRAKANAYEYGFHVPLAVRWPARVPGARVVEDVVPLVDLAPTFLEAAGLPRPALMTGRSMMGLLASRKQGSFDPARDRAFTARERHSSSRHANHGYPIRALRTRELLYIRNFQPERWPAGDPRILGGSPDQGFYDIDDCPTKSLLLRNREAPEYARFFRQAVEKRPAEELFDIRNDPGCLRNLAGEREHAGTLKRLRGELEAYLMRTGDPRMGADAEIFETYPRYSPIREFPPSP